MIARTSRRSARWRRVSVSACLPAMEIAWGRSRVKTTVPWASVRGKRSMSCRLLRGDGPNRFVIRDGGLERDPRSYPHRPLREHFLQRVQLMCVLEGVPDTDVRDE